MTEIMLLCAALKELLPFTFSVQVRHLLVSALFSQKHYFAAIPAGVGLCTCSASFKQNTNDVVAFKQSIIVACSPWQYSNVFFADEGQLYLPKVQTQVRPTKLYSNNRDPPNCTK